MHGGFARFRFGVILVVAAAMYGGSAGIGHAQSSTMQFVRVSNDKRGFVLVDSGEHFKPWGFNYDHDTDGRLIEDYWDAEWPRVEAHFAEMKRLKANVVRVHLQVARFLKGATEPNADAIDRLGKLVELAERTGLYLDLTGLGCYHKPDVPAWYDILNEDERWAAQALFWRMVAERCAHSPAVFCYDLMNEPVVPAGKRKDADWLGPAFAGKHFVQVISLDQKDRPREEIARQWIHRLVSEIRKVDRRHMITVGLVDWSLDRPGLKSGFVPDKVCEELDFVCVHLYPEQGKLDENIETLKGFDVGKPIVIEETFPLKCSLDDFKRFLVRTRPHAAGWVGFYWGKPPEKLEKSSELVDALMLQWLMFFESNAAEFTASP